MGKYSEMVLEEGDEITVKVNSKNKSGTLDKVITKYIKNTIKEDAIDSPRDNLLYINEYISFLHENIIHNDKNRILVNSSGIIGRVIQFMLSAGIKQDEIKEGIKKYLVNDDFYEEEEE